MWTLERKILLSACLVIVVATGLGTLAWRSSVEADAAVEWIEHTHKVLSSIEDGERAHSDITTTLQGYLLTGDRAYLKRRDGVWRQWQDAIARLLVLTADNPREQGRLHELQNARDSRMLDSREVEKLYLNGKAGALVSVVGDGALAGGRLDILLQEMRHEEEQLLENRKVLELDKNVRTRLALLAMVVLITVFPLFALLRLFREYRIRKTVEAERATLTDIMEATPDILTISGLDGRVAYLNPAGCAILGVPPLKPGESFPQADIKPLWSLKLLESEVIPTALRMGSWTGEGAFLSPTGQEFPVSQVVIAHRTEMGVTISTIARDISALRRNERILAEAGKFEMTHGKVLDIFNASFDRKEIMQGTLDALAENHPFPVSAVYLYDEWTGALHREAGRAVPETLAQEYAEGEGLVGQAAMENMSILVGEFDPNNTLVIETGAFSFKPKAVLVTPIVYQDRRQGVLVLAATRTLTERERSFVDRLAGQLGVALHNLSLFDKMKLLSDQLRLRGEEINSKNIQLQEADRLKSEFLANMSHELRTPLNSIIGFSEVLVDGLRGDLTSDQKLYVEQILDSGRHLLALINDILDLSKVEAGRMELDLDTLDIATVLRDSLSIVLEKAMGSRVELLCEPTADLGVLQADARKVKQILFNLLSNAVKFTPEGGTVRLLATRVGREQAARPLPGGLRTPLLESFATEFIEIEVSDTGLGIAREDYPKLFQPFCQLETSISRTHEGTGLGLAMVRKLAELHGGCVGVQSEAGRGSSFLVWLPYGLDESLRQLPVLAETAVPQTQQKLRALVVETVANSADRVVRLLEAEGLRVMRVPSFDAAYDLAHELKPHVMLMDVQPSQGDVWEFLDHVRNTPALADISIILMSLVPDQDQYMALGTAMVLQKPVSPEELEKSLVTLGLRADGDGLHSVLVVDDDPKALEILTLHLKTKGFAVERAYGGREAIEMARRKPFDLILLDLMMPEVSGFDVVEALKLRADTAAIPVLVLTAKRLTRADRVQLNGQGARVIEKAAFNSETFIIEVRRALHMHNAPNEQGGSGLLG